jgi:hypothetical protein
MPAFLWNTLDGLNPWHGQNAMPAHQLNAAHPPMQPQSDLYPHP